MKIKNQAISGTFVFLHSAMPDDSFKFFYFNLLYYTTRLMDLFII